jgi:hypothetical protein
MADVSIENAVVQRLIPGYGFVCMTTKKFKDAEVKEYFTVWNKAAQVKQYDQVNVRGKLQVKLTEFEGRDGTKKPTFQVNINDAEVELTEAPF